MGCFGQLISGQRAEYTKIFFLLMNLGYLNGLHAKLEKILTAGNPAMNFESWVKNCPFFLEKVQKFEFFQKIF